MPVPFDLTSVVSLLRRATALLLGGELPPWLLRAIAFSVLVVGALLLIWLILYALTNISKLWIRELRPLFYDPVLRRRARRRRLFAEHVSSELRRINTLEAWHDYQFADLETEVEAEGRLHRFGPLSIFGGSRSSIRRERSLTRALERSTEPLILLEGEPGAGKSVALRHLALKLAARASRAPSVRSLIPLYINLKELSRGNAAVDRDLIQRFVRQTLNRPGDRDVDEFLDEEYERGLREGHWLFLFDSFDEIPELISAADSAQTIIDYSNAIADYLRTMKTCRGVVASRAFRGPAQLGWPRFRVLPLSLSRQKSLIRLASLPPPSEQMVLAHIAAADSTLSAIQSNPMFLGLLAEHVRQGHDLPSHIHSVLGTYVLERTNRDRARVLDRFGVSTDEMLQVAERAAFAMASTEGAGLAPERHELDRSIRLLFGSDPKTSVCLDALVYIKLARSEATKTEGAAPSFTFAHRRLQEFFATRILTKEPSRVAPAALLSDRNWREAAIVLLQTHNTMGSAPIVAEAEAQLRNASRMINEATVRPGDWAAETNKYFRGRSMLQASITNILGILQDGFRGHVGELPRSIRRCAGVALSTLGTGTAFLKWSLDVAAVVPQATLLKLLRRAFTSRSIWLRDAAFRQVANLSNPPRDLLVAIRCSLVQQAVSGVLQAQYGPVKTHLARLSEGLQLQRSAALLRWFPFFVASLYFVLAGLYAVQTQSQSARAYANVYFSIGVLLLIVGPYLFKRSLARDLGRVFDFSVADNVAEAIIYLFATDLLVVTFVSHLLIVWLSPPGMDRRLALLSMVFVGSWILGALVAAISGRGLHYLWWPFLALLPYVLTLEEFWLEYRATSIRRLPAYVGRQFSRAFSVITGNWLGVLMLVLVVAAYVPFAVVIVEILVRNSDLIPMTLTFATVLIAGSVLPLWLLQLQAIVQDWFKWRRWISTPTRALSVSECWRLSRGYSSFSAAARFVQAVRIRNAIAHRDDDEQELRRWCEVLRAYGDAGGLEDEVLRLWEQIRQQYSYGESVRAQ